MIFEFPSELTLLAPDVCSGILSVEGGFLAPMWPPLFLDILGQESSFAVKSGLGQDCVAGRPGPHLTVQTFLRTRQACCSVKPRGERLPYQELKRTWPVARSGEMGCKGGVVLL